MQILRPRPRPTESEALRVVSARRNGWKVRFSNCSMHPVPLKDSLNHGLLDPTQELSWPLATSPPSWHQPRADVLHVALVRLSLDHVPTIELPGDKQSKSKESWHGQDGPVVPPWCTQQSPLIGESGHWITKQVKTHHQEGWWKGATRRRQEDTVTAKCCLNASSPNNHSPEHVTCALQV